MRPKLPATIGVVVGYIPWANHGGQIKHVACSGVRGGHGLSNPASS